MDPLLIHARHGDLLAYPTDAFLGAAIIQFGEYSELEYQFLADCLEPATQFEHSGCIIEVGANAGYLTIPLRRTGYLVIAYEPQESVRSLLEQNVLLNRFDTSPVTTIIYPVAVGSASGEIDCPVIPYSMPGNHGGIPMGKSAHEGKVKEFVKVPLVRLDDQGHTGVKLIKADVEGMELQVLKGARELILRDQPILYVENDRADKSQALIEYVWSLGYWCAWHTPPLFNPDNFFRKNGPHDNPWGAMASVNMVCLPKGRRLPPGVAVKHRVRLIEDATLHPTTSPL